MNSPSDAKNFKSPAAQIAIRFAELLDHEFTRLHIGCLMAAGPDWVEVSLPERLRLASNLLVRVLPSTVAHKVLERWRSHDRVGLVYCDGGPPEERLAGLPGLFDPRHAAELP